MKKTVRWVLVALCGLWMAVAPGMNFALQRKALPDGVGLIDLVYQLIARTTAAFSTDSLALAVLALAFIWLANRCLLNGRDKPRTGEYLLCAFLSGMMLLNRAIRLDGTVRLLWQNSFQVAKSLLYFGGMFLIYLAALRALRSLLSKGQAALASSKTAVWADKLDFGRSLLLLSLLWLPQIIIKYPGVIMWDTFHQIRQFIGDSPRIANHPPFGTLLYGLMYRLGEGLGNVNIGYLLFMLVQAGALLAVLAWSLHVMRRHGAPPWVRLAAFALYAISPCYAGWATVICKDTMYLILCLAIGVFLMEIAHEGIRFLLDTRRMVCLVGCFVLLWLTRYNGVLVVATALVALAVLLLLKRASLRHWARLLACAMAAVLLSAGGSEILMRALNEARPFMHDVLTIPFQQSAMVAARHQDETPAEEKAVIDRVVDYALIAERAGSWYADSVKDTYRETATAADRAEYLRVWAKQLLRYPVDNLDALLIMNGVLFDLQFNRPMYVSLTDNSLTDDVYPYSYNDMTLYNSKEIVPLNAAQRMLTQWYFSFDDLPLVGWFASMGFANTVMLMLLYLALSGGRKRVALVMIPSLVTLVGCLFAPVAYLRYALPLVCSLPLWFASYYTAQGEPTGGIAARE